MADSSPWVDQAQKLWALWDLRVSNAVFGAIEGAFGVEIRANPCPHTYDLPAVKTPTILVTWALIYLVIVGLGLVTITPADKTKKVRAPAPLPARVLLSLSLSLSLSLRDSPCADPLSIPISLDLASRSRRRPTSRL